MRYKKYKGVLSKTKKNKKHLEMRWVTAVKPTELFKPDVLRNHKNNILIYSFGQNLSNSLVFFRDRRSNEFLCEKCMKKFTAKMVLANFESCLSV